MDMENEDRALRAIMIISIIGLIDSVYLSYLHHLFKSKELLALQLVTSHNIFFMNSLMEHIRSAIKNDNVDEAYKLWSS